MKSLKKIIAIALMGLALTAGSAALVYAHTCPANTRGCWWDHAIGSSGAHYCIGFGNGC